MWSWDASFDRFLQRYPFCVGGGLAQPPSPLRSLYFEACSIQIWISHGAGERGVLEVLLLQLGVIVKVIDGGW